MAKERSPPDRVGWSALAVSPDGCLNLRQIIGSFSAPISEQHAWSICYEAVKTLQNCLAGSCRLYLPEDLEEFSIHKDGFVHPKTYLAEASRKGTQRESLRSENKAISELALVIYTALDFGLGEDEERHLSPGLENLLDMMACAEEQDTVERAETDDEGIEQDHDELNKGSGTCEKIKQICQSHLSVGSEAESHYRAVCRALVSEALELSSFIQKVRRREEETSDELRELGLQDWARIWVQVMSDLRHGVKLKKTNYSKTPIEYELTPYEILMDDIRSRRYKLNKVMVDGEIPPLVKKDAHDCILEFIRSRPPLKPASERQLRPQRKESTPMELLMESIRDEGGIASLRKTSGPPTPRSLDVFRTEYSRTHIVEGAPSPMPSRKFPSRPPPTDTKKVIQPDPDLLNFSDEDEDEDRQSTVSSFSRQTSRDSTFDSVDDRRSSQNSDGSEASWHRTLALDLAIYGHVTHPTTRRHSVTVCETPNSRRPLQKLIMVPSSEESSPSGSGNATPLSRPTTPTYLSSPAHAAEPDDSNNPKDPSYYPNTPQMHENLQTEFLNSEHWATALQTLDLSLDEVIHIRSVLTKAELEGLPLDGTLKDDVEKGKVCFLCMRTRFSFFTWGHKCQLCKQQVCNKCRTKMRIPLEHFGRTPVFTLSPNAGLSPEPDQPSSFRLSIPDVPGFFGKNSVGSAPSSPEVNRKHAPSSPEVQRKHKSMTTSPMFHVSGPASLGVEQPDSLEATSGPVSLPAQRVNPSSSTKEKLRGAMLNVCTDCREMVLQVIRAQRTARRLQMTKSLFLNLNPVYPKDEVY